MGIDKKSAQCILDDMSYETRDDRVSEHLESLSASARFPNALKRRQVGSVE